MFDEESAVLGENTSHLGQGLPQCNHLQSLPRTQLAGIALHWRRTQEEAQWGGVEERKLHLQCCSKKWHSHIYIYSQLMGTITQTSALDKMATTCTSAPDDTKTLKHSKADVWQVHNRDNFLLDLHNAFPFPSRKVVTAEAKYKINISRAQYSQFNIRKHPGTWNVCIHIFPPCVVFTQMISKPCVCYNVDLPPTELMKNNMKNKRNYSLNSFKLNILNFQTL